MFDYKVDLIRTINKRSLIFVAIGVMILPVLGSKRPDNTHLVALQDSSIGIQRFEIDLPKLDSAPKPFKRINSLLFEKRGEPTKKQKLKYTAPTVACYHFHKYQDLEILRQTYHELSIPRFTMEIPFNLRGIDNDLFHQYPHTVSWTTQGDFISILNLPHLSDETFDHKNNHFRENQTTQTLKKEKTGLAKVGYFYPPNLSNMILETMLHIEPREQLPQGFPETFEQAEQSGFRYLVSILDLRREDIPLLKKARTVMYEDLTSDKYKVDTKNDVIKFYFHFPYDAATAGLHLHARVNQWMPELEAARSFSINDVIGELERTGSTYDLILDRQLQNDGCIYHHFIGREDGRIKAGASAIIYKAIEKGASIDVNEVPNPFALNPLVEID
ncbi:MAG: hypothetical protein ABIQ95_06665 [Bdellovibrionia bacterium]